MSARSKDMIGSALVAAGIPMAGEVHLAAGPSTTAFSAYWADWFENDKYHNSTNDIQVGYTAMTAGRNDVLLVAPGIHHVSTALTWSKDLCHIVGAAQLVGVRPTAQIQPHGAVSPLINMNSTGCIINGITLRNGQSTGSTACVRTLQLSTASVGTIVRNSWIWGPEDDTVNDATGGWRLIHIAGDGNLFENCQIGYGWPNTGHATSTDTECLLYIQKSVFTHTAFVNCNFNAEFKNAAQLFILAEYSPAAAVYWTFRNCNFTNTGSTALTVGIGSSPGVGNVFSAGQNIMYFDLNCAFHGVTDVSVAGNESYVKWPGHFLNASSDATSHAIKLGLANGFDHTSG
jgi:hypothetical protein